jgi:hypothetical protein
VDESCRGDFGLSSNIKSLIGELVAESLLLSPFWTAGWSAKAIG